MIIIKQFSWEIDLCYNMQYSVQNYFKCQLSTYTDSRHSPLRVNTRTSYTVNSTAYNRV